MQMHKYYNVFTFYFLWRKMKISFPSCAKTQAKKKQEQTLEANSDRQPYNVIHIFEYDINFFMQDITTIVLLIRVKVQE